MSKPATPARLERIGIPVGIVSAGALALAVAATAGAEVGTASVPPSAEA